MTIERQKEDLAKTHCPTRVAIVTAMEHLPLDVSRFQIARSIKSVLPEVWED